MIFGSARLQIFEPTLDVRVPQAQVPYCHGTTSSPSLSGYSYTGRNTYTYNNGQPAKQGTCMYLDAPIAVPDVFLPNGGFVPTRINLTPQNVVPQPDCSRLGNNTCTWNTTAGLGYATPELTYITDPG